MILVRFRDLFSPPPSPTEASKHVALKSPGPDPKDPQMALVEWCEMDLRRNGPLCEFYFSSDRMVHTVCTADAVLDSDFPPMAPPATPSITQKKRTFSVRYLRVGFD